VQNLLNRTLKKTLFLKIKQWQIFLYAYIVRVFLILGKASRLSRQIAIHFQMWSRFFFRSFPWVIYSQQKVYLSLCSPWTQKVESNVFCIN